MLSICAYPEHQKLVLFCGETAMGNYYGREEKIFQI